jgi:hypothetical protein
MIPSLGVWVSEFLCLTPTQQERVNFQWDDGDKVRLEEDQHR